VSNCIGLFRQWHVCWLWILHLAPLVRPFVPNIENIPEAERAYYEKYLNAIFNNPTLIDFGADMLWTLISKEEA